MSTIQRGWDPSATYVLAINASNRRHVVQLLSKLAVHVLILLFVVPVEKVFLQRKPVRYIRALFRHEVNFVPSGFEDLERVQALGDEEAGGVAVVQGRCSRCDSDDGATWERHFWAGMGWAA